MPNTYVEQVASVVDGPRKVGQGSGLIDCPARVAGGLARVRPADIEVVGRSYLLNKRQPGSVRPAAFIEGRGGGSVALQLFIRSEEHTSELQSRLHLVCRLLLEKKNSQRCTSSAHFSRLRSFTY